MKKYLFILLKGGILLISFLIFFFLIKFIYHIEKEEIDTTYMWDISYQNLHFTKGSKEGKVIVEENALRMEVFFEKEEEFYEFQIDLCNQGSIDALITDIKTDNEENVLKTEVSYLDKEELRIGDVLKSGETKRINIRISYPKQEKKIYEALQTNFSFQITFASTS